MVLWLLFAGHFPPTPWLKSSPARSVWSLEFPTNTLPGRYCSGIHLLYCLSTSFWLLTFSLISRDRVIRWYWWFLGIRYFYTRLVGYSCLFLPGPLECSAVAKSFRYFFVATMLKCSRFYKGDGNFRLIYYYDTIISIILMTKNSLKYGKNGRGTWRSITKKNCTFSSSFFMLNYQFLSYGR